VLIEVTYCQLGKILDSLRCRLSSLRAHQSYDLFDIGTRVQKLLNQHFAHETRATGYENCFPSIKLLNRI
jgi:hypothetical protein